ncbi:MAG: hypothetical protein ACXAEU_21030 [Candidatus Hodarchaeales archaeon]
MPKTTIQTMVEDALGECEGRVEEALELVQMDIVSNEERDFPEEVLRKQEVTLKKILSDIRDMYMTLNI